MKIINRIHLAADTVVCGTIRESGVAESDIVWAPDLLSLGPILPPWEPKYSASRRTFWNGFYGSLFDTSIMPNAYESMCNAMDKFVHADEIIIWAGPSVDEQLFFVWSVAVLLHLGIDKTKLRYLLVTEDPHYRSPLSSLNMSREGYVKALQVGGRALDENDFEVLEEAWQTICSPEPKEIVRRRKGVPPHLSLVFDRISRLRLHYPNIRVGLNNFDYRLLQLCAKCGPNALSVMVEYLCNDHDEFDRPGDNIFQGRMRKLASSELKHPLLELEGDTKELRSFTVKLTDAGKAVLLGEANQIELNGIDEWIGGVHLKSPPGTLWVHDHSRDKLIKVE